MINGGNTIHKKKLFSLGKEWSKMAPYDFWNELGNPKYVCAPMVDQSELAFRTITRKYGCDLTFTPMIHSVLFSTSNKYRERALRDISLDEQPCFIQFCGHDPEMLLQAAKYVEDKTPCVDLNLGCPQGIAKKGHYGSFLLEEEDLVIKILTYLSQNLKCGVSCKIRLFPELERTYELVKRLEETGIKVLTVHGRTKEENKQLVRDTNLEAIKKIKQLVNIPVIANGSIESFEDAQNIFKLTNCDAVMSAEKLLENPFLFSGEMHNIDDVAIEYIQTAKLLETDINFCRSHLFKFFYGACKLRDEYNTKLVEYQNYDDFLNLAYEIKDFRKDIKNEEKFGWYFRYRREENPYKYVLENNNSVLNNNVIINSKEENAENNITDLNDIFNF